MHYCILLLYVLCGGHNLDTHIYFHSLHWEDLDRGRLVRHEPVELVAALVPLDAVEVVAVQVVAAHQVGTVPGLDIPRDPEVYLAQAGQLWNSEECSVWQFDYFDKASLVLRGRESHHGLVSGKSLIQTSEPSDKYWRVVSHSFLTSSSPCWECVLEWLWYHSL